MRLREQPAQLAPPVKKHGHPQQGSGINAAVAIDDDVDARLWEIAENLHRADLTVQERADHVAEWIKLTGEKISANLAEITTAKAGRPGVIDAARKELGISEGEARRSVKIASMPEAVHGLAAAAGCRGACQRRARFRHRVRRLHLSIALHTKR